MLLASLFNQVPLSLYSGVKPLWNLLGKTSKFRVKPQPNAKSMQMTLYTHNSIDLFNPKASGKIVSSKFVPGNKKKSCSFSRKESTWDQNWVFIASDDDDDWSRKGSMKQPLPWSQTGHVLKTIPPWNITGKPFSFESLQWRHLWMLLKMMIFQEGCHEL